MAAAALSRSRGVSGVRNTKGLVLILSLLCLVCNASSLIDKNKLEMLKQKVQKLQQKLDFEKATMVTTSELMNYYVNLMDPLTVLVKQASEELPDDFPPMEGLLQTLKVFVEKAKTFVDGQNEDLETEIENSEMKLNQMRELIKFFEEQHNEL